VAAGLEVAAPRDVTVNDVDLKSYDQLLLPEVSE